MQIAVIDHQNDDQVSGYIHLLDNSKSIQRKFTQQASKLVDLFKPVKVITTKFRRTYLCHNSHQDSVVAISMFSSSIVTSSLDGVVRFWGYTDHVLLQQSFVVFKAACVKVWEREGSFLFLLLDGTICTEDQTQVARVGLVEQCAASGGSVLVVERGGTVHHLGMAGAAIDRFCPQIPEHSTVTCCHLVNGSAFLGLSNGTVVVRCAGTQPEQASVCKSSIMAICAVPKGEFSIQVSQATQQPTLVIVVSRDGSIFAIEELGLKLVKSFASGHTVVSAGVSDGRVVLVHHSSIRVFAITSLFTQHHAVTPSISGLTSACMLGSQLWAGSGDGALEVIEILD
ncbi:hypothetical protein SS50377_22382 [Spironucleus salmonicida]|uniref:Uncharacterized protein n=1 Tax=Spironucleus salmonicida TaxID=348837 RepID=V6LCZ4_9EUKA|nr:hypothetical protein SS50377_22382 [Spironucleus salmonicida]|eukprot:EST42123.1 hypothetical protein SS50377_18431 [Spironucleus salmonicida]